MANQLNKITTKQAFLQKVLDSNYNPITDFFTLNEGTYLTNAGVIFIVRDLSYEMTIVSSTELSLILSANNLLEIGYGRWFFEIRAIFPNNHISTLYTGTIKVTPFS